MSKQDYVVVSPIRFNEEDYKINDPIKMTTAEAKPYGSSLKLVVEDVSDDAADSDQNDAEKWKAEAESWKKSHDETSGLLDEKLTDISSLQANLENSENAKKDAETKYEVLKTDYDSFVEETTQKMTDGKAAIDEKNREITALKAELKQAKAAAKSK